MTSKRAIKSAFESMLFVWGQPLDVKLAAEIFNINWKEAYNCFLELQEEYERQQRGIRIREVNKSFQFVTCEENIEYIERLCTPIKHKSCPSPPWRFWRSSLTSSRSPKERSSPFGESAAIG